MHHPLRLSLVSLLTLLLLSFLTGCSGNLTNKPPPLETAAVVGTYQAESASLGGGAKVESNHSGYTGSGFVNFLSSGSYAQWNSVSVSTAGSYTLSFRYALGSSSRTVALKVNGVGVSGGLTFVPTGSWTTWRTVSANVNLKAGSNTVRLETTGQDAGNVDRLEVATFLVEPLKVSSNSRYLQTASGKPMFIVADTMWGLASLSEAEADLYFKTRKEQGFNTILGPVVWGSRFTTSSGERMDYPLQQADHPFYRHLDMLVAKAKKHGLYLCMVVQWGEADRMSKYESPQEAYDYGRFIGNRYKSEPHLFWFGAGEYTKGNSEEVYADYHEAVSRGVKDAVGSRQLVSIHPAGGEGYAQQSSSYLFHSESWLDFNSIQTWKTDTSTFKKVKDDWRLSPTKPVFMSETKYEGEGVDAFRMRRLAYWSTFSGSLGFGYGHGDIWSGNRDGKDWQGALQAPGANDMRHLANLISSRSKTPNGTVIYFDHRPDDSVIRRVDGGSNPSDASTRGHVAAMRDRNGKYFVVYIPTDNASRSIEVDMGKIAGSKAKAWWYSPSSGSSSAIGTYDGSGSRTFKTPSSANDWVLVVDDASYQWGAPGQ